MTIDGRWLVDNVGRSITVGRQSVNDNFRTRSSSIIDDRPPPSIDRSSIIDHRASPTTIERCSSIIIIGHRPYTMHRRNRSIDQWSWIPNHRRFKGHRPSGTHLIWPSSIIDHRCCIIIIGRPIIDHRSSIIGHLS